MSLALNFLIMYPFEQFHVDAEVEHRGALIRPCAQVSRSTSVYIGNRPAFLKIGPPPTTASFASHDEEQGRPQVSRI
jgi:hypothetical protein